MVRLVITKALADVLQQGRLSRDQRWQTLLEDNENGVCLKDAGEGDAITHDQIIRLHELVPDVSLDSLLRGSYVFYDAPKPKFEPTSEYKHLMAALREEQAQQSYDRMLKGRNSDPNGVSLDEDDDVTYADVNRHLAVILNVLVSIIATSIAVWLATWHWSAPARLGLSMSASVVVAAAEVAIYAGYLRRISDAKTKEAKQKETREIVSTEVIQSRGKDTIIESPPSENAKLRRRKG